MAPDSATFSSAVHVERAIPPPPPNYILPFFSPLGPNPERNPGHYTLFRTHAMPRGGVGEGWGRGNTSQTSQLSMVNKVTPS